MVAVAWPTLGVLLFHFLSALISHPNLGTPPSTNITQGWIPVLSVSNWEEEKKTSQSAYLIHAINKIRKSENQEKKKNSWRTRISAETSVAQTTLFFSPPVRPPLPSFLPPSLPPEPPATTTTTIKEELREFLVLIIKRPTPTTPTPTPTIFLTTTTNSTTAAAKTTTTTSLSSSEVCKHHHYLYRRIPTTTTRQ